jgi:F0F1-type ATP synthase beta subunit
MLLQLVPTNSIYWGRWTSRTYYSTKEGSITSIQAVYVPADDLTDPAPSKCFPSFRCNNWYYLVN